jgi:hypothetical protein
LKKYPGGEGAELARRRLAEIESDRWRLIRNSSSEKELTNFLEIFPDGKNCTAAEAQLASLRNAREQQDWERVRRSFDRSALDRFAEAWPGTQERRGPDRGRCLMKQNAGPSLRSVTIAPLKRLLADYPDSAYKNEIKAKIGRLDPKTLEPLISEKAVETIAIIGYRTAAIILVPVFIIAVLGAILGFFGQEPSLLIVSLPVAG